ncbi:MAG TPA: alpha/beta fold hydrolase, partial [Bacteroidota bacterium]|nr:alpha/beta fold hydrolase [Bacteroidota bacterium]
DIPQQMAIGLPLRNVSWRPPKTHFELPAGPGLAVFDGRIAKDSVNGDFTQAGFAGTFRLERGKDVRTAPPEAAVPPPYREEEIAFKSGEFNVAGTLTVPPGGGKHPAVILITGSGAHNRDEELLGFRPFRIIADHLTRHGIAVLRWDDRGIGSSGGNKSLSTTADHAQDVLAGVKFLRARPDINPEAIGLLGHSEGGLIAPIVAGLSRDIAFIVLMAGPAVTGERLVCFQIETQMRGAKAGEEEIRKALSEQHRVFACVRADTGWDGLALMFKKEAASGYSAMPAERKKAITDSASFVNARGAAMMGGVRVPWLKYFIDCDPVPALEKVSSPVLALFGELDMQVPVSLNRAPMEAALARSRTKDWKVEIVPKANHLFIRAVTGLPSEYAGLEKVFVPGFLDLVTEWITKRVPVLTGGAGERGN